MNILTRVCVVSGLSLAVCSGASIAARHRPNQPADTDLKVVTRRTWRPDVGGALTVTQTVYVKALRVRFEEIFASEGRPPHPAWTRILRCDEQRTVILNPEARTYASIPIEDPAGRVNASTRGRGPLPKPGPIVRMTIDEHDTGERRAIGSRQVRHVITTEKVEPSAGARTMPHSKTVDGWYIDVPDWSCRGEHERSLYAFVQGTVISGADRDAAAPVLDSIKVTRLRTARKGYAIEETERVTHPGGTSVSALEFVESSVQSLPDELFEVPAGYRPALPFLGGGVDMTRPDTLMNRASAWWDAATLWARQLAWRLRWR